MSESPGPLQCNKSHHLLVWQWWSISLALVVDWQTLVIAMTSALGSHPDVANLFIHLFIFVRVICPCLWRVKELFPWDKDIGLYSLTKNGASKLEPQCSFAIFFTLATFRSLPSLLSYSVYCRDSEFSCFILSRLLHILLKLWWVRFWVPCFSSVNAAGVMKMGKWEGGLYGGLRRGNQRMRTQIVWGDVHGPLGLCPQRLIIIYLWLYSYVCHHHLGKV